ncbi:MAG: alpha/beta fold hydrolase [Candidatus Latescibacteria bacterium]|nr:alpha/beta fold hydrolase [Candidatus Latescibacterota bacterium]
MERIYAHLYRHATSAVILLLLLVQATTAMDGESPYSKETHVFKIVEGDSLKIDLMRLADDQVRPIVIWIHAGGLIMGGPPNLQAGEKERLFLDAGYAVAAIEYRVAPEHKLPTIIEDVEDAYNWVRNSGPTHFNIDPDRIALLGHSAGGYLSLIAGARLRPRPKALVAFYCATDISGTWITQYEVPPPEQRVELEYIKWPDPPVSHDEAMGFLEEGLRGRKRFQYVLYCYQKGIWPQQVTGRDPQQEPEWFHQYEPVRNVTKDYPPTMLLYGEVDTMIPLQQGIQMAAELERAGIEHEFLTFPGFGHMFDEDWSHLGDPSVQDAYARILQFLDEQVQQEAHR